MKAALKRIIRLPPVYPLVFTAIASVIHFTMWNVEPLRAPWNYVLGVVFVCIAVTLGIVSAIAFRRHGESLDVGKRTQKVVEDGIYAFSRNPVYLGFVLCVFGIGCIVNSVAIMLATIPTFAGLNWYTIPKEERYLRDQLGADYEHYTNRVRRWL